MACTVLSSLIDYLTTRGIPFTASAAGLHVQGTLLVQDYPTQELPADLTVAGSLDLIGSNITSLPDQLVVQQNLLLSHTFITALPADMKVCGNMMLRSSQVTDIPEGFHVEGFLDLRDTPIAHLPKGLFVGGKLNLRNTGVSRFPDMHVGSMIVPPASLRDIQAYMSTQPTDVILRRPPSSHQRVLLRAQLQAFPDLWRVVASLSPEFQLSLRRDRHDQLETEVEPVDA